MSSRLDRLLLLLESGSTPIIRKSAAEQLGDVQKLYPHELDNLLNKVHAYLMNSQWETRVAASQAVEAIIKNVDQWNPSGKSIGEVDLSNHLSLSAFNISRVLDGGVQLNMCDAKNFDFPTSSDDAANQDANNKDRLVEQKLQLDKKLGLQMCGELRIPASESLITEEDFMVEASMEQPQQISSVREFLKERLAVNGLESQVAGDVGVEATHPSRKRKADDTEGERDAKVARVSRSRLSSKDGPENHDSGVAAATPTESDEKQQRDWPLMAFSNLLSNNLFSQVWEKRHGSALGLKVLVKLHGRGGGRSTDVPCHELNKSNQKWLEDLCVRLMCVLALDRLGDFLSDEVIAPVRESCAQVIGVVCLHLEPTGIISVVRALLQFLNYPRDIWEVKHGGLLGIKYVLAVRQDLTEQLLQEALPSICQGLTDNSDDVRSVAASALIPITNALVQFAPAKALEIIDSLWTSLKELDDLTSSTNSVMTLLSLLVSHPDIHNKCQNDSLTTLVPFTWPFLNHNISSVRRATLLTLDMLLQKSLALNSENSSSCSWLHAILPNMMRLIFQRSIIEHEPSILEFVCQVWSSMLSCVEVPQLLAAVVPYFSSWMCLAMHPSGLPLDRNLLLIISSKSQDQSEENPYLKDETVYLSGISNIADSEPERDALTMRARLTATRLLGQLCHKITDPKKSQNIKTRPNPQENNTEGQALAYQGAQTAPEKHNVVATDLGNLLQVYLSSKSAVQRMVTAWVIKEWAESAVGDKTPCECPLTLVSRLKECLVDILYFDEIATRFTRLQGECRAFMASLLTWGACLEKPYSDVNALLTLEQISQLCNVASERGVSMCRNSLTPQQELAYQKQKAELEANLSQVTAQQEVLANRVQCSIASVLVELRDYPESLNPVIRPLMECLKMEENVQLQEKTAEVLSQVVGHHKGRTPCPSTKIVKNLCSMYYVDATLCGSWDKFSDIQVLKSRQQVASSWKPRKYGPFKKGKEDVDGVEVFQNAASNKDPFEVQKRGSILALVSISRRPGPHLPQWVPDLWKVMFASLENFAASALADVKVKEEAHDSKDALKPQHDLKGPGEPRSSLNGIKTLPPSSESPEKDAEAQDLLKSLIILNLVAPHIDRTLQPCLISHFPHFLCCIEHPYTAVRHAAGRCLATVSRLATEVTMEKAVFQQLVPWLSDSSSDRRKMGAIEALSLIIEELNVALLPYLVGLVLPMLGAMSDSNPNVRLVATNSFATLVRLMPLDKSLDMDNKLATAHHDTPTPSLDQSDASAADKEVSVSTVASKNRKYQQDRMFLEQLLDPKLIEDFQIPIKLKVELRRYQQDGLNWLSFLSRYKLHGVLCDDMGLGKTLQSLCIIVSNHYNNEQAFKKKQTVEPLPISLVVCPPTLTAHWLYEVEKVVPSDIIRPLHYVGSPSERMRLQKFVSGCNLVLASYDVVRNDIDFFSSIRWNYCILDEGHVIKNNKTKLAKAIKQLQCDHRLILSGTPIQNNVLELWSLFDFLMPGYLGTEKQFQITFGRPILASRDARSSSKEQEAGTLALEALHRQVLPFMLRRLKEDVLKDLPPKIITDYYCDLSPLQVKLYEDYSRQHIDKIEVVANDTTEVDNSADSAGGSSSKEAGETDAKRGKRKEKVSHIFQALQYLRKVCNHPLLATSRHDDDSLRDIVHTSKLVALKQLLNDCGIGVTTSDASSSSAQAPAPSDVAVPVVSQHRVILFCQMKIMLDIIERDLFKRHMTTVSYLRLDGSIPAANRLSIVHRFNNDPSIDVLLLTTQVGGLGLNLTGADTVVFYDHDWNPMKDLQAMDRAHRIGQKKVVTIYRLITRGTLEEKIMGLQKFKMNVAQSVVNQDNHSLASMGSNQLLDLFCLDKSNTSTKTGDGGGQGRGLKSVLEDLENLWDESHYRDEYDVDAFVKSLD